MKLGAGDFPLLAVDPGLNAIGWAYFHARAARPGPPLEAGVIHLPGPLSKEPLHEKAKVITEMLLARLGKMERPATVAVELAEVRGGAMASAAGSDVVALGLQAGMTVGLFMAGGTRGVLLPVSRWKGQLPKEVVEARLEAAGALDCRLGGRAHSHAVDAVGVGLVAMGWSLNDARWFDPRRTRK